MLIDMLINHGIIIILNNNIINSNFEFNALLEVENEDWCMMEVYLNGILCIEESLEKYR